MYRREGVRGTRWLWVGVLALVGWAQGPIDSDKEALRQVGTALAAGDAEALLAGAAGQVSVTIDGQTAMYSRAQARYVMRAFFSRRPPARFVFGPMHRSGAQSVGRGTYWTHRERGGHNVYIRLRWKNGRWQLKALHIQSRNRRWIRPE